MPHNYTVEEMRQLRAVHVKVQSIPYYMDIIINNRVVCVIGFFLARKSAYDNRDVVIIKGVVFDTLDKLHIFLQVYQ